MKPSGRLKITEVNVLRATLVAFVPFLLIEFVTGRFFIFLQKIPDASIITSGFK